MWWDFVFQSLRRSAPFVRRTSWDVLGRHGRFKTARLGILGARSCTNARGARSGARGWGRKNKRDVKGCQWKCWGLGSTIEHQILEIPWSIMVFDKSLGSSENRSLPAHWVRPSRCTVLFLRRCTGFHPAELPSSALTQDREITPCVSWMGSCSWCLTHAGLQGGHTGGSEVEARWDAAQAFVVSGLFIRWLGVWIINHLLN